MALLRLIVPLAFACAIAAALEEDERMGFFGNFNTEEGEVQVIKDDLNAIEEFGGFLSDLEDEDAGEVQLVNQELILEDFPPIEAPEVLIIDETSYNYQPIISLDYIPSAPSDLNRTCIAVNRTAEDLNGQTLVLGDCVDGWRFDDESDLFRSQLDDSMCMQAGSGDLPKEGNVLRLAPCNNKLLSQQFQYSKGFGIHPVLNPRLCVVWKGYQPQPGSDPIMLSRCRWVQDRIVWSFGDE